MRLSLRNPQENVWEIEKDQYIWLENASDEHLMLHLASGDFRFDKGRTYRFRKDILDDPNVHALLDERKLAIRDE
jgi:hypothetical protein